MSNATEAVPPRPLDEIPIEELAVQQGVQTVGSLDELARPGSWESDEEFEDFLADLYDSRRSDAS